MKRKAAWLLVFATLLMTLSFSSCFGGGDQYEIALVVGSAEIENDSFNKCVWRGVKEFADANGKSRQYYVPDDDTPAARANVIRRAISMGARVVVCAGDIFESAVYEVQSYYPAIRFLLVDGEPNAVLEDEKVTLRPTEETTEPGDVFIENDSPETEYIVQTNQAGDELHVSYKTAKNVHCILFREEQAGYLAGYAAVRDGYTRLGFAGGSMSGATLRYNYGFLQGINDAALEMGIVDRVHVVCKYIGDDESAATMQGRMEEWYETDAIQVIMSCGGEVYSPVFEAAEKCNGRIIAVDYDQAIRSPRIICSAIKDIEGRVAEALEALYIYDVKWDESRSGKTAVFGLSENSIGIAGDSGAWRFGSFTKEQYEQVCEKIKLGLITVSSETSARPDVSIIVDYQK